MKVLITGPSLDDPGGVANYYNVILPFLRIHDDITYVQLGSTHSRFSTLHPLFDQIKVQQMILSTQPDVIHVNPSLDLKSFLRDGLIIYLAAMKKIPVLVFFRGWDMNFEKQVDKNWIWFFRKTYLLADTFIVLSQNFKEKLIYWGVTTHIHSSTTTVSQQIIDNFNPDKYKNLQTDKIKILFMSRIEKEKGLPETIEGIKFLLEKGYRVSLSVAGKGQLLTETIKYVNNHQLLKQHIDFMGYLSGYDKTKCFNEHHIFCFPTNYGEGMPNVLLEAMGSGMPIITCPVGGITDFFEDPEMGHLIQPGSGKAVANALLPFLENNEKIQEIGHHNHQYAAHHFSGPQVAQKLRSIYKTIRK